MFNKMIRFIKQVQKDILYITIVLLTYIFVMYLLWSPVVFAETIYHTASKHEMRPEQIKLKDISDIQLVDELRVEEESIEDYMYDTFTITAYDNSVHSQGKWVDQTATGFNLKGHSLESAKCIAVDPTVIPLHSKVEIIFDDEFEHLSGVYTAYDTGGLIKGKIIDLFYGDGIDRKEVFKFGRRSAKIRIIE